MSETLEELKRRAAHCVTHHDACDCREYQYREAISDLLNRLALWRDWWEEDGKTLYEGLEPSPTMQALIDVEEV